MHNHDIHTNDDIMTYHDITILVYLPTYPYKEYTIISLYIGVFFYIPYIPTYHTMHNYA